MNATLFWNNDLVESNSNESEQDQIVNIVEMCFVMIDLISTIVTVNDRSSVDVTDSIAFNNTKNDYSFLKDNTLLNRLNEICEVFKRNEQHEIYFADQTKNIISGINLNDLMTQSTDQSIEDNFLKRRRVYNGFSLSSLVSNDWRQARYMAETMACQAMKKSRKVSKHQVVDDFHLQQVEEVEMEEEEQKEMWKAEGEGSTEEKINKTEDKDEEEEDNEYDKELYDIDNKSNDVIVIPLLNPNAVKTSARGKILKRIGNKDKSANLKRNKIKRENK